MLVARPLPSGMAVRVTAVAAVVAIAWLRDAMPVPGAPLAAPLAFFACALMGSRLLGVAIPAGSLAAGLGVGLLGAVLLLALPVWVHQGPWHAPTLWLLVAVTASAGEELATRGLVFGLLAPWGTGASVAGSTLVFAAMHALLYPVAALPLLLAAGLVLGTLRWLSGGCLAPTIAHVLTNAVAAVA